MHYATPHGSIPLDFELYLPGVWMNDPDRCRKVGVPADAAFQTKWAMAHTMLDRVPTWGLADQVAAADAGYGKVCEFRDGLTERGLLYIVGVDETTGVWIQPMSVPLLPRTSNRGQSPTRHDYGDQEPPSVLQVAQGLPSEAWKTISWDQGSRGPLQSRFAALRVHPSKGYHEGKSLRPLEWLLIEWPEGQDKPEHYWLSTLPEPISLVSSCLSANMAPKKGHFRGPAFDPALHPAHDAATSGNLDRGLLRLWLPSSRQAKAWRNLTHPVGQDA